MKIAIYGDIHDSLENLKKALAKFKDLEVNIAFCLGDLNSPFIAKEIIEAGIPTDMVWGNNDGDKAHIKTLALESDGILEISRFNHDVIDFVNGKTGESNKVYLDHYPIPATAAAKSGDYDAVFYGHTHESYLEILKHLNGKECILANPGSLSSNHKLTPSFMIWDTESGEVEKFEI